MALNIIIPELNSHPSTKDAVINILTLEWPLSLKSIFYKMKKKYNFGASYQAVFKTVKELVDKGVLIEKDKQYEINLNWVKEVQSFTDVVETNYYAKERIQSLSGIRESKQNSDIIILNFESIFDAEKYLYYYLKYELLKIKNDSVCWNLINEWRPLFYLRSEYNIYSKLKRKGHKFYCLCSGNSKIEKNYEKFYNSIGVHYSLVKEKFPSDIIVFGDYYISLFIPEDLRNKMKVFLKKGNIVQLMKEVMEFKSSIKVVIHRDPGLAADLKKQIVRRFK